MTLALVDLEDLEEMMAEAVGNERCYAGTLHEGDAVLRVAVQAGIPLPLPMKAGMVPPPPPPGRVALAGCYRAEGDGRLRCIEDGKVIYGTAAAASSAAKKISDREPMKGYTGTCGHHHVSRRKK